MTVVDYQRFKAHSIFGLIGTGRSAAFITRQSHVRRYVAVTGCQLVLIWDTKKQAKVASLQCPDAEGTAQVLAVQPPTDSSLNNSSIAVGYSTGEVVVFSIEQNSAIEPVVFTGHRGVVSSLAWDNSGTRLASAGVDGEIVIWDATSERGIIRLRGHKGVVNRVVFMKTRDGLVSCGRDKLVKLWDIPTGHCYRTLAPFASEVWDIALLRSDTRLVVAGNDATLNVWGLTFKSTGTAAESQNKAETKDTALAEEDQERNNKQYCLDTEGAAALLPVIDGQPLQLPADDASEVSVEKLGVLPRSHKGRVIGLSSSDSVLTCHSKHESVDLYSVLSDEQIQKRLRKRLSKTRKRLRASGVAETETAINEDPQLCDEMRFITSLAVHDKLSSVCITEDGSKAYFAALYTNNSLAVLHLDLNCTADQGQLIEQNTNCHITLAGHRAEVRAVQFSSVGDTIVSLSNDALKTWHRSDSDCQCVSTAALPSLVRCMVLAPGDRHAVLGAASGHIFLVELATGAVIEDITSAHCSAEDTVAGKNDVTALSLTSDSKGLVSGGMNNIVRIWRFELVSDDAAGRRLSLESASDDAIKLDDGVTALHCSPDGKLIAVATINNKETLYYADTMKLHQELYGKALPSACVTFNPSSSLVVTGCKDSAIRIYGTDFGDMRKFIKNAHTGGVTSIEFQGQTNLFFSTGNDGLLNYWDAGSFQRIMTLRGHTGIGRCLSVAPKGNWVVTCGQDYSLRLWERTQDILNLQEEREEERRRLEDEELGEEETQAGQKRHVEGETRDSEAVRASRPTVKTEEAVDQILAGLQMYQTHLNDPDAAPHYLMLTYGITDPVECFAEVLNRIKTSLLEEAIVQLELSQVLSLLVVLARICKMGLLTEAIVRVTTIAVRINMPQLTASNKALPLLSTVAKHTARYTKAQQDILGFVDAGLRRCIHRHEERHDARLFADALGRQATKSKKNKKKEIASRRARLAIS